ncbi:hypothetical protein SAPIO_CDS8000 [Scedosporium apiospermum]|uniref:Uncharacterized protein n=1 Tax=Pseudallescheria apiosperma TaxID=563466 RepID=A0A084G0E8_PSEDA|nr:uncharacterized protein SAPIO_CDS8000 [Scedosporium apiospermum]KEZ40810.1 hypothetical protein SAPIO_CDS8000 [Scedosporium apiospermum]
MAAAKSEDFNAKYTDANLASDAAPYDSERLCNLVKILEDADNGSISTAAPAILSPEEELENPSRREGRREKNL